MDPCSCLYINKWHCSKEELINFHVGMSSHETPHLPLVPTVPPPPPPPPSYPISPPPPPPIPGLVTCWDIGPVQNEWNLIGPPAVCLIARRPVTLAPKPEILSECSRSTGPSAVVLETEQWSEEFCALSDQSSPSLGGNSCPFYFFFSLPHFLASRLNVEH